MIALVIAGYALLMLANPVRASLRDGWRCVRRYPVLWKMFALLAFANALFTFAVQLSLHLRRPSLMWVRAGWFDPSAWWSGTPDSVWWLPPSAVRAALSESWLPALESIAGIFNNAFITFPVAVIAALGLFLNRNRTAATLARELRRRLRAWAWPVLGVIFLCAAADIFKAVLYFRPAWIADATWYRWAPMLMWPAALFEYLFGVAVQAYLLLHAYAWVRGISFEPVAMRVVAIRRLGSVLKWATLVMLAQTLLIELPLALAFACGWPASPERTTAWLPIARTALACALIAFASMQAWLTLHGETLRRALAAHWRLLRSHFGKIMWFITIAALHLYALHFARTAIHRGLGEDTVPGIVWTLLWPLPAGLLAGWLLASWVCLFKALEEPPAGAT